MPPPPRKADTDRWARSALLNETRQARPDEDTQFATQFQRSPVDYLGGAPDIGRVVGAGVRELFISCEIGDALEQQFEHLQPSFIALHDQGCVVSRRLLAAVATASGQAIERLVVRRAGFGTVIATLEYIDCSCTNGRSVRIYSTDADADSQSRQSISRVLLTHATLGAILLGDLPGHALLDLLEPLRQAVALPTWEGQQLLFLPLGPGPAAGQAVHEKLHNAVVPVAVSPRVTIPAEAWAHLHTAWNHLQRQLDPDLGGLQLVPLSEAATQLTQGRSNLPAPVSPPTASLASPPAAAALPSPAGLPAARPAGPTLVSRNGQALPGSTTGALTSSGQSGAPVVQADRAGGDTVPQPLRSLPAHAVAGQPSAPGASSPLLSVGGTPPGHGTAGGGLGGYLRGLAAVQGLVAACVFEVTTSRLLAHLGDRNLATELARRGTTLLAASSQARKQLQLGGGSDEVLIRGGAQSLAIRVLASQPEWAVHLIFTASQIEWGPLRNQLIALDNALQRGPVL